MTDFRALCAELLASADEYTGMNPFMRLDNAMKAARAALAQPEPQEPTDEDVLRCLADVADECILIDHPKDVVAAGRQLLARWGRPTSEEI